MRKKIRPLEREIEKIKREIVGLGDLRPGSLSKQYNVCGNPNCRCKGSPPQKHGPYYQLSYSRNGKSSSRYVRREEVTAIRQHISNYARLRKLVDQWIDLAIELSDLKLRGERRGGEMAGRVRQRRERRAPGG